MYLSPEMIGFAFISLFSVAPERLMVSSKRRHDHHFRRWSNSWGVRVLQRTQCLLTKALRSQRRHRMGTFSGTLLFLVCVAREYRNNVQLLANIQDWSAEKYFQRWMSVAANSISWISASATCLGLVISVILDKSMIVANHLWKIFQIWATQVFLVASDALLNSHSIVSCCRLKNSHKPAFSWEVIFPTHNQLQMRV